ncbi:flagellar protein FlgN [Stenotrophomonas rhizophila]|uniref:flagellar protein FlgN n=1 Tax=Stenotrophomonas rhizophila TaxID=216778 RepID=UPI001E42CECF|nr:flagellar protein FlgN [Stenotrophomonas rhizophila]MCC7635315.1 flagellar protein FlgN [Stenotrophomonas rhizophila]MCC7663190.1 flagellar protein FlgN [Stenotrophomonas rhizophila]
MNLAMSEPLQRLSDALDVERQALIEHDVHALIRATGAKLDALRALEAVLPVGQGERLQELAERNRANGVLLSRRRREVNWALRQLGRSEDASAYDAKGQANIMHTRRPLAVA